MRRTVAYDWGGDGDMRRLSTGTLVLLTAAVS